MTANPDPYIQKLDEERKVEVGGVRYRVSIQAGSSEWCVYYEDDPPSDCHPELGVLSWTPVPGQPRFAGAIRTTGLEIVNMDGRDRSVKEERLRKVAAAAGLEVRPASSPRGAEQSGPFSEGKGEPMSLDGTKQAPKEDLLSLYEELAHDNPAHAKIVLAKTIKHLGTLGYAGIAKRLITLEYVAAEEVDGAFEWKIARVARGVADLLGEDEPEGPRPDA